MAASDPHDNNQRENMEIVRAILGRTLALAGDIQTGTRNLQQAVDLANQLLTVDPHNTSFQEHLALYGAQLSRLLRLQDELPAASALITRSMAIFLALTKQDPTNSDWQREFAETKLEQAEQSLAANHIDVARDQVQSALRIVEPLRASQPDDRATLLASLSANLLLASVTNDVQAAQKIRADALSMIAAVKNGNNDPRLLALQAQALLASNNKDDAQAVIHKLWSIGYRDVSLLNALNREGIDYPVNSEFQQKLLATTEVNERK